MTEPILLAVFLKRLGVNGWPPQFSAGDLAPRCRAVLALIREKVAQIRRQGHWERIPRSASGVASLFRREAVDAKRDAWLGRVQLVEPLPVRLVAVVSTALVAA